MSLRERVTWDKKARLWHPADNRGGRVGIELSNADDSVMGRQESPLSRGAICEKVG